MFLPVSKRLVASFNGGSLKLWGTGNTAFKEIYFQFHPSHFFVILHRIKKIRIQAVRKKTRAENRARHICPRVDIRESKILKHEAHKVRECLNVLKHEQTQSWAENLTRQFRQVMTRDDKR